MGSLAYVKMNDPHWKRREEFEEVLIEMESWGLSEESVKLIVIALELILGGVTFPIKLFHAIKGE